jgi:glycosyltransferase involved in cell wall biosynthesis
LKKKENVRLVIVGDGSERKILEKQVLDLGLIDKVIFIGYVSNNEKYNLLSLSDIFILPSFSDTFPIAVLKPWDAIFH